jgi:hypothetical protein
MVHRSVSRALTYQSSFGRKGLDIIFDEIFFGEVIAELEKIEKKIDKALGEDPGASYMRQMLDYIEESRVHIREMLLHGHPSKNYKV